MDKARTSAIRSHHSKLRTGIIVNNLLPDLHCDAGGFLTDVESAKISSMTCNVSQVDELITVLLTKEDRDYDTFCRILQKGGYPGWSEKLNCSARQNADVKPRRLLHPIKRNYVKIMDAFCNSAGRLSLDALKHHCCALVRVDESESDDPRMKDAIGKVETIQAFANILFFDLSQWISFDFLDEVIDHFQPELEDVKEQLTHYKEKLHLILMQKLKQISELQQQEQEDTSGGLALSEIVAKYRLDADGLKVEDLIRERDFLAERLGIPGYLLQVLSWRPGSIVIVFLILRELQPLVERALHRSDFCANLASRGVEDIYLRQHSPDSIRLTGGTDVDRQDEAAQGEVSVDASQRSQNLWDEPLLEREIQKMMQTFFSRMEKELDVHAISVHLVDEKVLDSEQKEEIDSKDTSKAANTMFATYLYLNVEGTMLKCFLKVLESDVTHLKHRTLAKDMRKCLEELLSTRTGSSDAEQPSQQGRGFPVEESSPGLISMKTISKEFDGQLGYALRYPDNRDVDHLIPEQSDSVNDPEQNDSPVVQNTDFDPSWNIPLPFIHDEAIPDDDLGTDEVRCAMGVYSHQKVIQRFISRIVMELDVRSISGALFSAEVLNFNQKQEIDNQDTNEAANTVLAAYLHQSADSAKLEYFLRVLEGDETHPKHWKLATDIRDDLAQLLSKGEGGSEHAQQRSQPGYSPMEGQDIEERQPDRLEEQNDRPEVECTDLESSETVELPFISNEAVPEDAVDVDDTTLEWRKGAEQPNSTTVEKQSIKKTALSGDILREDFKEDIFPRTSQILSVGPFGNIAMKKPSGDISSSLGVVCYPCLCELSIWKCIKSSGFCRDPSHNKVFYVWYEGWPYPIREKAPDSILVKLCNNGFECRSGLQCKYSHCEEELSYWRDPSKVPPCEVCMDCRWGCCITLFERQCFTGTHSAVDEVVVYKDEVKKDLVEIRCPLDYLSMREKKYQCNHTLNECRHHPIYACGFPHTEVEQEIWNVWKGTASANVSNRTARRFLAEIKRAYSEPPEQKLHQPSPRKISGLLTVPLTAANYKDKFHLLIELEKEEHVLALERCNGTFAFKEYRHSSKFDRWQRQHQWYGSLEVPQYLGDHVRQAATHVELEREGGGWKLTGDIIPFQKFLDRRYILLVGFVTGRKPPEVDQQRAGYSPAVKVVANFCLKYRYFENLQNAIEKLPDVMIPKLMLKQHPTVPNPTKPSDMLGDLPSGFQLDEEYQGPTCWELLRSSPNVPFLITGPFGTGKTRLIAAAAYCILKTSPQSRILIATHHQRTADEYVETYFTEALVEREGLEVVRMVSKETPPGRLSGLTKVPWMVKDSLHKFQLVITTFVLSMGLSRRLKQGHFTHIFIDEGAQAREPETIAAFSLAGRNTKIVIAGDHMQVGPKTSVLGKVPRDNGLADSLLVRLRNLYSSLPGAVSQVHQSELLINYRCHPAIVRLPSRLFYDCRIQTQAKSVPYPGWEKMVYFVCSSFALRGPAADSKWSTQKELLAEAELEVRELKQRVHKFIHNRPPKRKPTLLTSAKKTKSGVYLSEMDLSSVCVLFPTRLTETLWKKEVHDSSELRQVTCAVAYDIQGREFDAIFVCTAQPVNQDYSPFDPVKSMCDPFMFNTIVTRPKSLLVVIGNPFRLRKIEQITHSGKIDQNIQDPPACWSEYLYQCWEGGSLQLSAKLREGPGACKKELGELEKELMVHQEGRLRRVAPMEGGKEEGKDVKKDTPMLGLTTEVEPTQIQCVGWNLGVEKQVVVLKDEDDSHTYTECKLDGYSAIPTKPGLKPIVIPSIDERRCAFDGATVMVEETKQLVAGRRTGKVVSVEQQGPVEPMICTVDPHNPLILVPIGGKNPKILNRPVRTKVENDSPKPSKKVAVEAVVKCYSPECHTRSVDAIPIVEAIDRFFLVQPLQWSIQERYPVGAVVRALPKSPSIQLAEQFMASQYKVPQSLTIPTTEPISAIGIKDNFGRCSVTFSVKAEKNHFIVAVHISNVINLLSGKEEFKKRFGEWSASYHVLPPDVLHACDFSKTPIQKAITVEFKVEEPMSIFSVATRKNMLVARPSVKLVSIQETAVQCCSMLAKSDVEYILLSLQTGPAADGKLAQGMTMSVHDALTILYCTAEHQHKARHGHGGYPLLEMTSYEHPETEKMVNELLTMANSEVAEMIAKAYPDRALLVTQDLPDHSKEEIAKEFSSSLALFPAMYPWLTSQSVEEPKTVQPFIVFTEMLRALIEALRRMDFLEARQLLYFLHGHPQFAPLQEAIRSALTPEHFSAGNTPTHVVRQVPYTSCTNPLGCIGDVFVQEQLLAAVRRQDEPPRSVEEAQDVAAHCNRVRLNAKEYDSAKSKLSWAYFAQNSSLCVQSIVRSMKGEKLHLCCQYDHQGGMQESITVSGLGSKKFLHTEYTAKVTSVTGLCQVATKSEYQGGSDSISVQAYGKGCTGQDGGSCCLLVAPQTVEVPVDTLHTVLDCVNAFDEEKAGRALKSLQQLEKQEHSSPSRRGLTSEPEYQDAHFFLLEFPLPLSPYQLVDVWMRMDTTQFIPTPKPQLLEIGHSNVRVCLHHTEQSEACFTAGSTVQAPQQVQSSIESYVSEWVEVLLAEAACRSVERKRHMLINDVLIRFNTFTELDMFASKQFYQPVSEVTMVLSKAFVEDRQDIFPLEQGDLVCARYEVNLLDEEAGVELLERHGNCFPPRHGPVGRLVLHMVVEKVVGEGTQQEVMMSQEVVQGGVEVYLRVVGEQGAQLSPLMRDLLVANKHTCQVEVVPMEPQLRRVYQCLQGLGRGVEPSKLGKDIICRDLSRFKDNNQVPDRPTFAELEKECPKVTHLWHKSIREKLNAGQQAALERAYQSRFHIIQGPPGTEKLVVAVHLAYAFAQKNRRLGVRKATGLQHCVLLCAPDDTAVDTTLSLLQIVAGSSDKNIRVLRIYSREVERKHCPGPYQDTNVFEETATADYSIPQSVEKFALHKLTSSKLTLPAELEEKVQYSNMEVPPPDQRSEYRQLVAEAERQVIQEGQFDVVLCTCSEAGSARIQRYFTPFQCIVYEASLATEPETVAAIARSSHQVVLIGDHSSVCPPVCSQVAGLAGLGVSLFDKYARQLMKKDEYGLYSFLEEQYRMMDPLCEFPSREFYNGQLKPSPMLKNYSYPRLAHFWPKGNGLPLVLCNVKGTEERDGSKSAEDTIVNRREAEKVVDIVQKMVTALSGGKAKYVKETLAVLTTTEAQKSLIQSLLRETNMDKNTMEAVWSQVMTIRASRGAKANLVVLSTVRSCSTGAHPTDWTALLDHQWVEEHLGLLCWSHHTCLALTTAKHGLVIVGDRDLLCHNDTWRHLVEHCKEGKGCLVESDTFPSEHFIQSLQQAKAGKNKK